MDDQLFAHFLDRLRFSQDTRLRLYHDNHEGPRSRIGDEWFSEDETLVKIHEAVCSLTFGVLQIYLLYIYIWKKNPSNNAFLFLRAL